MRRRWLRPRFVVPAAVLALGLAAAVTGAGDERSGPVAAEEPVARPDGSPERRAPVQWRNPIERTAVRFATDWLDYLAGARPVSAVRGASPELLASFAGGDAPEDGPGADGLRSVRCSGRARDRHLCVARVDRLGPLRFVAAAGEQRVEIVELDLE